MSTATNSFKSNLLNFDLTAAHLNKISKDMTPRQMREYYIYQTDKALSEWEKNNFSIRTNQPFELDSVNAVSFKMTPEFAKKINLRQQVEAFAKEAKVSTAGVRENQNVVCPWDHRYRINEYMIAMIAEALSVMVKELQAERLANLPPVSEEKVREQLGDANIKVIESIYGKSLKEIIAFVKENPVRIVGGEVRSNTPRFSALMSRIYAANGLYVFMMKPDENGNFNSSAIFMWSFLVFLLGLSGGDFFTSSHGAPQKQSDKILSFDGAQYLPDRYDMIVENMWKILEKIETEGYEFRLAAQNDPHILKTLDYENSATLYSSYLRQGPASEKSLNMIKSAGEKGLRLKLDFFGGAGYKTISAILKELGVFGVFDGGLIRTEEDPFFHNIGFAVSEKKNSPDELEVTHLSVDASIPKVVATANYNELLKGADDGQVIFNVDPDVDRFVGCQLVPATDKKMLDELGVLYNTLADGRLIALYSPNQLFLMIAHNDMVQAKNDGIWDKYDNFDIHTYVSALAWDEWAEYNKIPVLRVPVGFKEIAAIERAVEDALKMSNSSTFEVANELGQKITVGKNVKLHHAGEESGGKIGGPKEPIYNVLGEFVIAMREKSSGEACFSAIALQARVYLESVESGDFSKRYLHNYLKEIFTSNGISNQMETRGDIIHYNEAIIDPAELAKAKQEGLAQRDAFNSFFRNLALAYATGKTSVDGKKISLEVLREILAETLPVMKEEFKYLEDLYVWSDGLQFWFAKGRPVRDICLRPSGTDAKSKVYCDGTDKAMMRKYFDEGFAKVTGERTALYAKYIKD